MHRRIFAAALVAFFGATPCLAAYKCENGGQIVYSDTPCGKVVGTLKQAPAPSQVDQLRAQAELASMRQQLQFDRDIQENKVRIGMSPQQVVAAWGAPTKINRTISQYGTTEQWVYRRSPGMTQYVYIEGGRVTSISD